MTHSGEGFVVTDAALRRMLARHRDVLRDFLSELEEDRNGEVGWGVERMWGLLFDGIIEIYE